jgi:hypothetical protein
LRNACSSGPHRDRRLVFSTTPPGPTTCPFCSEASSPPEGKKLEYKVPIAPGARKWITMKTGIRAGQHLRVWRGRRQRNTIRMTRLAIIPVRDPPAKLPASKNSAAKYHRRWRVLTIR